MRRRWPAFVLTVCLLPYAVAAGWLAGLFGAAALLYVAQMLAGWGEPLAGSGKPIADLTAVVVAATTAAACGRVHSPPLRRVDAGGYT